MTSDFPRILTLLRKERGISQKIAAVDLGVSQSLLSHYEKGIRECGLEFLLKTASYYNVSCDYLLGRSADKSGSTISVSEIPEPDALGKENMGSIIPTLNKKLIANSLNIVFDLLSKTDNDDLVDEISAYMMLSVYKVFRTLYGANAKNQDSLFHVHKNVSSHYADATMAICEANARAILMGMPVEGMEKIESAEELLITTQMLTEEYPLFASSLLNLVKNAEYRIEDNIKMPSKQ